MAKMPIKATYPLKDECRKNYSSEEFFEDLKTHILSDEEPVIELFVRESSDSNNAKGLIFPDDNQFSLDFLENRICNKPIICGSTQPTCFTGGIDLQNIQFKSRVSFVNAQFYGRIEFSGSKFENILKFDDSKFSNSTNINFSDCIFNEETSFRYSELRGQINFYHARFHRELIFYETNIHQFVNFSLVRISHVLFSDIKVLDEGLVYFEGLPIENKDLILIENIDLSKSTSTSSVPFYFYSLYAIANEPGILFKKIVRSNNSAIAYFDKCYLEKNSVRFEDCDLRDINSLIGSSDKATDNISYRNCLLAEHSLFVSTFYIPFLKKNFKIYSLDDFSLLAKDKYIINEIYQYLKEDIEKIDFSPIELKALNLYENLAVTFKKSFSNDFSSIEPHKLIYNIKNLQDGLEKDIAKVSEKLAMLPGIHKSSEDTTNTFKDKVAQLKIILNEKFINLNPAEFKKVLEQFNLQLINQNFLCLKEKYAFLKSECEKNGDKQTAANFHFCQLYWFGQEKKDLWNKLYLFTCAYGLSWQRPLALFVFFIGAMFLIYSIIWPECKEQWIIPFELSFGASTVMFNPGDLIEKLSECSSNQNFQQLKIAIILVLFWVQKVIQLFLLFEVGAAIRNKVKR